MLIQVYVLSFILVPIYWANLKKIEKEVEEMKLLKLVFTFVLFFGITAPSISHAQTSDETTSHITVESFEMENLSSEQNNDGLYENIGSKKVNSITEITEGKNSIQTKITALEDFYDLEGEFQKSVFKIDVFTNDYSTGKAKHKFQVKEFDTPQTIENVTKSTKITEPKIKTLTDTEKNTVTTHLKKLIKNNHFKVTEKDIDGITFEKMKEMREMSKKLQEAGVLKFKNGSIQIDHEALSGVIQENTSNSPITTLATVEARGAFDNYYNHNLSTGAFVAQALSGTGHKYVKITGTTYNNTKNANTMVKFKSAITSYESYVIQRMEYATWTEVAGWFGVLMGLVTIVAGYGTGPVGWVAISLYYGGALATFAGLTSTSYATYSRLSLSKSAAQYCQTARDLLYYTNWSGTTATVVSGF